MPELRSPAEVMRSMATVARTRTVAEVLERAARRRAPLRRGRPGAPAPRATWSPSARAAARCATGRTDPDAVTFIVDRNINYTNVCVTDCDFCAFYRRPGDPEGYVLPKPVIFQKIEETLELGGTGVLLQGGHHPDLRIEWYEDLFRSIKARYPIHLHALSPPEIHAHRATLASCRSPRRSRRLRDAGLDSLPGGGAEILVDRVRKIIAPKKTTTDEWLDVMRARPPARHVDDRDDDVRPRRDLRGARRAPAAPARAAGRDARLPRLHLLDLPAATTRGWASDHASADRRSTT